MDIQKYITNLYYGTAYSITFDEGDSQKCYDLWLDKEDTFYCLQEIYLHEGIPEEVGNTTSYNKKEIERKLLEFSSMKQFQIQEMD